MSKGQMLQDPFLNALRKDKIAVSIFLVNGIKLQGYIESFDQYVVLLKNTVSQMVYKHAISTIVPTKSPNSRDYASASFTEKFKTDRVLEKPKSRQFSNHASLNHFYADDEKVHEVQNTTHNLAHDMQDFCQRGFDGQLFEPLQSFDPAAFSSFDDD